MSLRKINLPQIEFALSLNTKRLLALKTRILKTISWIKNQQTGIVTSPLFKDEMGKEYVFHPHQNEIIGNWSLHLKDLENYHAQLVTELNNREHVDKGLAR